MKLFNLTSVAVFALLAAATFAAGFYNPVHFVFCAVCIAMVCVAATDSTDGESVIDVLRTNLKKQRR